MENANRDDMGKGFGLVLLIEDDEIVMEVNKAMIERLGYRVVEASTGQMALDIAADKVRDMDLAMLDMDMPDMKGPEIFDRLMGERPGLKVVVCSGQAKDAKVTAMLQKGACDFLPKPFTYKILEEMLVKHLDRRNEQRVKTYEDFLSVANDSGVYNIRIIDISKGGLSFSCDTGMSNKDAMIDVAVIMAEKGVNLDELECRIVSDKSLNPKDLETGASLKRKGVSFGKMTKQQFDKLSELIKACAGKE